MYNASPDYTWLRPYVLDRIRHVGECWQWTLDLNNGGRGAGGKKGGYGRLRVGRKIDMGAHRASYMAFVGAIPEGLTIDHLCRNTWCVNPQHLEPVTQWENTLRGNSPVALARRTGLCKRGHRRVPENLNSRGQCRRCQSIANKLSQQKRDAVTDPAILAARREAQLAYFRAYNQAYKPRRKSRARAALANPG